LISSNKSLIFATWVYSRDAKAKVRTLIDSIHSFAGPLSECPIWVFEAEPQEASCQDLQNENVEVLPLELPHTVKPYAFARKVFACYQAELRADQSVHSLVYLDPCCLIINPPLLFDLGQDYNAAIRPVHIRNVGSPADEPVDAYWEKIYATLGVEDVGLRVESFVDRQQVRAYFNSAAFAVNPSWGLCQRWLQNFEILVNDDDFQATACRDDWHQIFLHQAVLSALVAAELEPERLRLLPPDYGYPYNLHFDVIEERKARALNNLVCVIYEDRSIDPQVVDDIEIHEPLKSWLNAHIVSTQE
jgi:hypothetical protein